MVSSPTFSMFLFVVAVATATAQELPKRSGPADFDPAAPTLMLNDVPDVHLPGTLNPEEQPPADVAKLEAAIERAKKNAALREQLCKTGVVSKLEAEQGEMKVVRLTKDLENARLEAARRKAEALRQQPPADAAAKQALAQAEAQLATASTAAQDATAKWEQAQRASAELRVQRERKLLALGAGSKWEVKQAEAALLKLVVSPVTPGPAAKSSPPSP